MSEVKPLRLVAEDAEDLKVMSAAVQDSVARAGALKYDSRQRRFSIELNRYRWEAGDKPDSKQRVRAILAFDGVLGVKTRAVSKADPELILSLLSASFDADDEPPGGEISLLFAGDGELRLTVEALDATLLDSDYVWPTRKTPSHDRRR